MPTYDYECKACHHRFEVRQGFHDDRIAYCPLCSKSAERKISLVPVIFKGSGWYVTDYAKKSSSSSNGQKKETDKDSKSSDKNATKESTKSEKASSKKTDSKKDTATSKNKSDS